MTTPISHPVPPGARGESHGDSQTIVRTVKDRQFLVAVVLLGVTAVAWPFTIAALKWTQIKTPVAWPAGIKVSEDFRWTNLPDRLGKYVVFDRRPNKQDPNTKANGEIVLSAETRDTLGVGRYEDAPRRAARSSNWYVSRIYEDPSWPMNSPLRFWQLEIVYYTGAAEKVEHVPDRCMIAGGYVPSGNRANVNCKTAGTGSDWPDSQEFVRTGFVTTGKNSTPQGYEVAEYYTFILNGTNETSWERVRLHMATTPWEKHCYFAKIQFMPMMPTAEGWKPSLVSDLACSEHCPPVQELSSSIPAGVTSNWRWEERNG
jgi:hypothetical protein